MQFPSVEGKWLPDLKGGLLTYVSIYVFLGLMRSSTIICGMFFADDVSCLFMKSHLVGAEHAGLKGV